MAGKYFGSFAGLALIAFILVRGYHGGNEKLADHVVALTGDEPERSQGEHAFDQWLDEDGSGNRLAAFKRFNALLTREGVNGTINSHRLWRTDRYAISRCNAAPFVIPPERQWPNLIATLKIVRDLIEPEIGNVNVVGAWRSPEHNKCANGAIASKHLSYAALDLIAVRKQTPKEQFTKLCALWRREGAARNWGLGAYFDPDRPGINGDARFHVDATGWRSWGFSKGKASSFCLKKAS